MLPEYEIAIARGYDIEQTKKKLTEKARSDYQDRCQAIEHDARIAELVLYVLRTEPTWSPGYAAARGLQKRLRKEHPEDDRLARELRKLAWVDDKQKGVGDDDDAREPAGITGQIEGTGSGITEAVPAAIQGGES